MVSLVVLIAAASVLAGTVAAVWLFHTLHPSKR